MSHHTGGSSKKFSKCRTTMSGYLVFFFFSHAVTDIFVNLMRRAAFIKGNLNRAARQRQKDRNSNKAQVKQTVTG